MGKINRGDTTKLSIKLSTLARQKLEVIAKNLNLSVAGVILFEMTKILENPPSKEQVLNLESKIELFGNGRTDEQNNPQKHFVMSVNINVFNKTHKLAEEYDMKKNILIGLIVSNHFENMEVNDQLDTDPTKMLIQVNENLKKKMIDYSEKHYIALSGLISYSIQQGPHNGIPVYKEGQTEKFFSSVPSYVLKLVKEKSDEMNIREHFYVSLCLYKQFMTPEGKFY